MRFSLLLAASAAFALPSLAWPDAPLQDKAQGKDKDAGKVYSIPYRLSDSGHIVVRVKINGKGPYNFIVDTGAPLVYFAQESADKIGIKAEKKELNELDKFEIEGGPTHLKFKALIESPPQLDGMNSVGFAGVHLHGIIGYSLLAHYKMEIDFTTDRMKWTRLDFTPPPALPLGIKGDGPTEIDTMGKMLKGLAGLIGLKGPRDPVFRGFLGLQLVEKDKKVVVENVLAKSPAEAGGLKAGDRLLTVQSKLVATPAEVMTVLAEVMTVLAKITPGQEIRFVVERDGGIKDITITAGEGL